MRTGRQHRRLAEDHLRLPHPSIISPGHSRAAAFGPKALQAVRQSMIDAGLSRGVINQRVGRIRRVFKRAAADELIPVRASVDDEDAPAEEAEVSAAG